MQLAGRAQGSLNHYRSHHHIQNDFGIAPVQTAYGTQAASSARGGGENKTKKNTLKFNGRMETVMLVCVS